MQTSSNDSIWRNPSNLDLFIYKYTYNKSYVIYTNGIKDKCYET